jgi:putative glutamine amidotransferase
MQALNVARGGTLHQHLPDVVGTDIEHRQAVAGTRPTHWVSLEADTLLADTLRRRRSKVNSFHHQALDRLGDGLTAVAWAADGVIEGVVDAGRPFVVGVQWHAESLVHRPEHCALFAAFVAACERYERSARPWARAA